MPRLSAGALHRVRFKLNGRAVSGSAEPRMLLSDFLRHVLGATGTHVGCEHGVCGACTVQIDGAPARSCITLAVQAEGADIRTVEGLAEGDQLLRRLTAQNGYLGAGQMQEMLQFFDAVRSYSDWQFMEICISIVEQSRQKRVVSEGRALIRVLLEAESESDGGSG